VPQVGYHNSNMTTPNIDGLVKQGIELDRVYSYHYCSPTRSSLLTGRLPFHVNQITATFTSIHSPGANISGKIYPDALADVRMSMLPRKLAAASYVSYHVGKW
jgi:arylsulfatase I/J